ncbi:unnamed protein product, partial [Nesidiocoris tenuis]
MKLTFCPSPASDEMNDEMKNLQHNSFFSQKLNASLSTTLATWKVITRSSPRRAFESILIVEMIAARCCNPCKPDELVHGKLSKSMLGISQFNPRRSPQEKLNCHCTDRDQIEKENSAQPMRRGKRTCQGSGTGVELNPGAHQDTRCSATYILQQPTNQRPYGQALANSATLLDPERRPLIRLKRNTLLDRGLFSQLPAGQVFQFQLGKVSFSILCEGRPIASCYAGFEVRAVAQEEKLTPFLKYSWYASFSSDNKMCVLDPMNFSKNVSINIRVGGSERIRVVRKLHENMRTLQHADPLILLSINEINGKNFLSGRIRTCTSCCLARRLRPSGRESLGSDNLEDAL